MLEGESEMHENPETSLHSAKAVMEQSKKKTNNIEKSEAVTNKTFQLASEKDQRI